MPRRDGQAREADQRRVQRHPHRQVLLLGEAVQGAGRGGEANEGQIDRSRESELVFIRKIANILAGYFDAVTVIIPKLMPVLCFAAYPYVTGSSIPASKAFTLISLLKQIESSIFYSPWCISAMALMK